MHVGGIAPNHTMGVIGAYGEGEEGRPPSQAHEWDYDATMEEGI